MFDYLQLQLGLLTIPIVICAVVTVLIWLERLTILGVTTFTKRLNQDSHILLEQYQTSSKTTREEIATVWLSQRQQELLSGIRLLQIIALISPLLGLLGTVIGLIEVFHSLGEHQGPIEPALLASGLGVAMKTTAAGLLIAVPALLGVHLMQLWAEKLTHNAEHAMNLKNLQTEGVCTKALT